jgi:anhydro-N-acetylmuramic acid kinase
MAQTRYIAGAMSGTSADGVDVALTRVEGSGLDVSACVVVHCHRPYPDDLRQRIFQVRGKAPVRLEELADLARQIALVYAAAVNETLMAAKMRPTDVTAIAAHGQTLFHAPPLTIQWIDPSLLAAETGIAVVSDFRRADCAAGGQGAPLVPLADYLLFRHRERSRVLINIGGIANLTWLRAGGGVDEVIAFDTGPGNCVSDWLMRRFLGPGAECDVGGGRALSGKPLEHVVAEMLRHSCFRKPPPKSTDGPEMVEVFRSSFDRALGDVKLENLLATAALATSATLVDGIDSYLPQRPDEVIVSGGGIHNRAIMAALEQRLGGVKTLTTDDLGVKSESKEALAFALLGAATLDRTPGNIPNATGARRGVVLGSVTPVP